jgi:hypothetical protein
MKTYHAEPGHARRALLQIILAADQIRAVEDFRFEHRMPSRAAAVRELMRRGLEAVRARGRRRRRGTGAACAP